MLAIRLARFGKKKQPFYRVVVLDKRKPRNGRTVEVVGTYDPQKDPADIKLDAERIKYWLSVGAKPSDTVHNMLVSLGVIQGKKINILPSFKEPVKEEAQAEAAAPVAEAVAPAEAAPAEEVKEEAPAQA